MRTHLSPSTGRRYSLALICRVYRLARSSVYAGRPAPPAGVPTKRGPKTVVSDEELLCAIRQVLRDSPFHGGAIARCAPACATRASALAASASCA